MSGNSHRAPHYQRGTSLIEALVGFLLIAVAMLGSAQMQLRNRQAVDLARQQTDAARAAQHELETLRAFASHETRPGLASFAAIADRTAEVAASAGSTTAFRIDRQVLHRSAPDMKEVGVVVSWADHSGVNHQRPLFTLMGGQAPALILPLGQASAGLNAGRVLGRHAAIPLDAHDLGDGRSVFKPLVAGTDAWLFDNRSGHIVSRCTSAPANRPSRQLTAADLAACIATDEVLLAGRIRHALALPPAMADPAAARDAPLPMAVTLQLSSSGHPGPATCIGEAVKVVDVGTSSAQRAIAVPIDATPTSQGLLGWTDLGDRFWRYHCAVTLARSAPGGNSGVPQWSGRLLVAPSGWAIGSAIGSRRICRYSADTDSSGEVDRAAEAPDELQGTGDALLEQNYLVIDASQPCPIQTASTAMAGSLPWSSVNPATVPHQP